MKLCWKRRGCSCLVTYGKYLGLAGFLGRWAVLVCGITILETVLFFLQPFITIIGKQSGSWSESIFFGGVDCGSAVCKSNRGKRLVFLFFCLIFRNLLQFLPIGRHSVWICPVWFFFSLLWRTREPLVLLDIPSLSVWEKKTNVWLLYRVFFYFLFLFAKHIGVGLGGRESYIWTMRSGFAGRVFQRDSSRAFSIHIWSRPFSVLLQIFMGNSGGVGTADRRYPGNFIWRMCVV
jgi:hypothetical protein